MKYLFLILPFLILSCTKKNIESITIHQGNSSEINLFKGSYLVRFMDKEDAIYKFPMSSKEIEKVKETYQEQEIDNYGEDVFIVGNEPLIMPNCEIKYNIVFSDGSQQVVAIRSNFNTNPLEKEYYTRLKVFLDCIDTIIHSKKQITTAKKSNYLYL